MTRVTEQAVGTQERSVPPGGPSQFVHDELIELIAVDPSIRLRSPAYGPDVVRTRGWARRPPAAAARLVAQSRADAGRCRSSRPAAVEQLKVIGSQVGVGLQPRHAGPHRGAAGLGRGQSQRMVPDLDTAGRLHVDDELMPSCLK